MKNIIQVDISTYIIIFLYLISGNFKSIIIILLIIIIHELGHIFYLKIFNKEIVNIKIYPFGGITKYNSLVNHNLKQELLISIGGIVNQILLYIIFIIIYKYSIINSYTYNLFNKYNLSLIIFNSLPIIGLDGEKIIHTLLEYFIPYHRVNNIMIIISVITFIIFIIYSISIKINILFVISFLLYKLLYFIRNKKYLENKFLLERYIYDIPYNKIKYINNINNMYQQTYHFFNHIKEYDYLKEKYKV